MAAAASPPAPVGLAANVRPVLLSPPWVKFAVQASCASDDRAISSIGQAKNMVNCVTRRFISDPHWARTLRLGRRDGASFCDDLYSESDKSAVFGDEAHAALHFGWRKLGLQS